MVRGSIVAHHAKRQTVTEKDLECLAKLDSANSASAIVPSESSKPKKRKVSKWEPCAFSAVVAMSDRELIGRDFVSTLSEWCGFGGLLLVSQQGVGRHRLCQWTKKSITLPSCVSIEVVIDDLAPALGMQEQLWRHANRRYGKSWRSVVPATRLSRTKLPLLWILALSHFFLTPTWIPWLAFQCVGLGRML